MQLRVFILVCQTLEKILLSLIWDDTAKYYTHLDHLIKLNNNKLQGKTKDREIVTKNTAGDVNMCLLNLKKIVSKATV